MLLIIYSFLVSFSFFLFFLCGAFNSWWFKWTSGFCRILLGGSLFLRLPLLIGTGQYSPWSNLEATKGDKNARYLVNVLKGGFTARILVPWVCWMLGETKNILRIFLLRRWSQLLYVARDQGDDREYHIHSTLLVS